MVYTKEDLDEFRHLVELGESQDRVDRIESRLKMSDFVEKHGKEKCDKMFEVLVEEYDKSRPVS